MLFKYVILRYVTLEKVPHLVQYVYMKKFFTLIIAVISALTSFFSLPVNAALQEYTDANTDANEIEVTQIKEETNDDEELMFEPIDLDLKDYNNERVKKLKIRVESNEKPKYIKNYRKTWDDSKFYRYQYYSDQKNLQPLIAPASYGAYLETQLDDNTTVQVGQYNLSWYDNGPINFIGKTETDYDSGATITGHGRNFDYAFGMYTATNTLKNSYGGIISTKPKKIWHSKGDFSFGTGMYSNDYDEYTKNTAGFFTKYRRGKFTVSGQVAQNSYTTGTSSDVQSFHLVHQYKINDHFMIRGKMVKELNTDYSQDELSLRYSPSFKDDRVFFELTSSQVNNLQNQPQQRFKIMTNINF